MVSFITKNGLTFLLLLTTALYLASLNAGFVFDDRFLIVENHLLKNDLSTLLFSDLWAGEPHPTHKSNFYRPLFLFSIWIDHQFVGLNPWFFHLHSLAWHLGVVTLTYLFVRSHLNHSIGLIAAFIAALHPLQSEVAIWISARNDSIAAFFCLAALLFLTRRQLTKPYLVGGAACSCLAVLSKESTLFLPLCIILFSVEDRKSRVIASVVGLGAALLLRWQADVQVALPSFDLWLRLLSYLPEALSQQIASLAFPWPLSAARRLDYLSIPWWNHVLTLMVVVGIIALFMKSTRFGRAAICLAILSWLPSWFGVVNTGTYGDRYLYLTVIGFGMALAAWMQNIKFVYKASSLLILALFWIGLVQSRLPDWKDDRSFWGAAHRDYNNPYTAVSLAYIEYNMAIREPRNSVERLTRQEYAISLFEDAYAHPTPYVRGCDIFAQLLLERRGPQKALDQVDWMMENGCPLVKGDVQQHDQNGKLAGVMAEAMVSLGNWDELKSFLSTAPRDLSKRDRPIMAALAILDGDVLAYKEHRSQWLASGQELKSFKIIVDRVLRHYLRTLGNNPSDNERPALTALSIIYSNTNSAERHRLAGVSSQLELTDFNRQVKHIRDAYRATQVE